jgi:hypothetical protein
LLGVALFLSFGFSLTDSALVALGILTALSICNAVAGRKNDRTEVSDQVSGLARGSSDIARQVAEFGRRLRCRKRGRIRCRQGGLDGAPALPNDCRFQRPRRGRDRRRALASSLVFEFTQNTVRNMGPMKHESLAALAERLFCFSMDNLRCRGSTLATATSSLPGTSCHLTDLRAEPRESTARGFRFVKASALLLLNRVSNATTNIHPADFSDLLGRFGIDLIAERIESESIVIDLLDYDVRFGQGFLFSLPRRVCTEALQCAAGDAGKSAEEAPAGQPGEGAAGTRAGGLAQLAGAAGRS